MYEVKEQPNNHHRFVCFVLFTENGNYIRFLCNVDIFDNEKCNKGKKDGEKNEKKVLTKCYLCGIILKLSAREQKAQRTLKIEQQRQILVLIQKSKICANQENSLKNK